MRVALLLVVATLALALAPPPAEADVWTCPATATTCIRKCLDAHDARDMLRPWSEHGCHVTLP